MFNIHKFRGHVPWKQARLHLVACCMNTSSVTAPVASHQLAYECKLETPQLDPMTQTDAEH
jgi:hypothetical protein